MKYRRLTNKELEQLEENFIRFLAAHSITGPDWANMKTSDTLRAEALVEEFSDLVIEKTLHNVEYLEFKEKQDFKTFHCLEDKIVLFGVMVKGESELSFLENISAEELMAKMKKSNANLQLYTAEKVYKDNNRKREIFNMLESGCLISNDGAMFKILEGLEKEN